MNQSELRSFIRQLEAIVRIAPQYWPLLRIAEMQRGDRAITATASSAILIDTLFYMPHLNFEWLLERLREVA